MTGVTGKGNDMMFFNHVSNETYRIRLIMVQ